MIKNYMHHKIYNIFSLTIIVIACSILSGCFVAPLRVANPLNVTVQDAETGHPIPDAQVVYIVSDIHDFLCKEIRSVRTTTDKNGHVDISGKRKWVFWIIAPGGLPAPDHFIAIWAPGYSTYLFNQYSGVRERTKRCKNRSDIQNVLSEIPQERLSTDPLLNPASELIGGKIKLMKIKP